MISAWVADEAGPGPVLQLVHVGEGAVEGVAADSEGHLEITF